MKADAPESRELSEVEQARADRYHDLLACGIDPDVALRLVHIPDIGHRAKTLHDAGCSPKLIVEILT